MSYGSSRATATPVTMSKQDYQSVKEQQKLQRMLEKLQLLITYCTLWSIKNPIDLMDCPSNMEIGLCWYKKETNNKWTYNLTDQLMLDLETIIALASMTYIIDLDAYELHPGDEKVFNNFINEY